MYIIIYNLGLNEDTTRHKMTFVLLSIEKLPYSYIRIRNLITDLKKDHPYKMIIIVMTR